jgi:hypothetical protein
VPPDPVADTVIFDGQVRTIGGETGGSTVTRKLQLVTVPQLSLALV